MQKDGDQGSYPMLAHYFQRLRAAQGTVAARKPTKHPRPVLVAAPRPVLTAHRSLAGAAPGRETQR